METKTIRFGESDLDVHYSMHDDSFGYDYGSISATHHCESVDEESVQVFFGDRDITAKLNDKALCEIIEQLN